MLLVIYSSVFVVSACFGLFSAEKSSFSQKQAENTKAEL
jgi:hypothetical protein